jgi:predicted RNA-binding protein associated with RNAse of E/G family
VSYDEEVLLRLIRNLGVDGIIKTKEYIDFDALEVALHRNQISKEDIKEGIIVKPDTVTLNCRQKKQLNE